MTRIQIVSGAIYASEPSFIVDVGIFVAGSTSHLGRTEDQVRLKLLSFWQFAIHSERVPGVETWNGKRCETLFSLRHSKTAMSSMDSNLNC
jgi:hypothetical protein